MSRMAFNISAVLFDFWNTLFIPQVDPATYWRLRAEYVREALESFGYSYSTEDVLNALRHTRKVCDVIRRFGNREISVYGEVAAALHFLGIESLDEKLVNEVSKSYARPFIETPKPDEDAELVLSTIKEERGLKTGIISNTMFSWANRELLRKYNLQKYFDVLIFSDEMGRLKPDPVIFRAALSRLGVKAENAIMVGDEPADVIGARAVGMRPILVARSGVNAPTKDVIVVRSLKEVLEYI